MTHAYELPTIEGRRGGLGSIFMSARPVSAPGGESLLVRNSSMTQGQILSESYFGSCTPLTSTVSLACSLILFTKSMVVPVVVFLVCGRGCTRWSGFAELVPERCCCVSSGLRVRLQVAAKKKACSTGTTCSPRRDKASVSNWPIRMIRPRGTPSSQKGLRRRGLQHLSGDEQGTRRRKLERWCQFESKLNAAI